MKHFLIHSDSVSSYLSLESYEREILIIEDKIYLEDAWNNGISSFKYMHKLKKESILIFFFHIINIS